MFILKLVNRSEESRQGPRIFARGLSIAKNLPERRRNPRRLWHLLETVRVELEFLSIVQMTLCELSPAIARTPVVKKELLVWRLCSLSAQIRHELVNDGDCDLFDLGFGIGDFSDQSIASAVD